MLAGVGPALIPRPDGCAAGPVTHRGWLRRPLAPVLPCGSACRWLTGRLAGQPHADPAVQRQRIESSAAVQLVAAAPIPDVSPAPARHTSCGRARCGAPCRRRARDERLRPGASLTNACRKNLRCASPGICQLSPPGSSGNVSVAADQRILQSCVESDKCQVTGSPAAGLA